MAIWALDVDSPLLGPPAREKSILSSLLEARLLTQEVRSKYPELSMVHVCIYERRGDECQSEKHTGTSHFVTEAVPSYLLLAVLVLFWVRVGLTHPTHLQGQSLCCDKRFWTQTWAQLVGQSLWLKEVHSQDRVAESRRGLGGWAILLAVSSRMKSLIDSQGACPVLGILHSFAGSRVKRADRIGLRCCAFLCSG